MEFYVLKVKDKTSFMSVYWGNENFKNNICEVCEGIYTQPNGPLVISYGGRGEIADFYRLGFWNVVSPNFMGVLEENDIKGVEFKDILIKNENGTLLTTDAKELEVSGRGGLLTDINGNEIRNCPLCHRVTPDTLREHVGITINLNKWDGSDIFYFDNWIGNPIVTEKVKIILEKSNLKNIRLINTRSYVFNYRLKKWRKTNEK